MDALKSTIYAWLVTRPKPVTFREVCDHFPKVLGCDIHKAMVEMIEEHGIETIPAKYQVKQKKGERCINVKVN